MAQVSRLKPTVQTPIVWALALSALAVNVHAQDRPAHAGEAAALEAEIALLERRLELADVAVFYLVLNPAVPDLTLMFGGAALDSYPVSALDIARPRLLFAEVGEHSDWLTTVWEQGALAPPPPIVERAIQPPQPGVVEVSPVVPPTVEEMIPVPARYRIRFAGGQALEVTRGEVPELAGRWIRWRRAASGRWQDLWSVLRRSDRDVVRVRVSMAPAAADALYRALPPDVKLLVLPFAAQAPAPAAPPARAGGGEAALVLPDLGSVDMAGLNGRALLLAGLGVCLAGLLFGLVGYVRVRRLPAHESMLAISELICRTCRTYLIAQGRFILLLEVLIGGVIAIYFGLLLQYEWSRVAVILLFSLVGIAGSYGVAWFGIRINTIANARTAFASLRARPLPVHEIPLQAGMSIGMMLISVELFLMLVILLFVPGDYAGACFTAGRRRTSQAPARLRSRQDAARGERRRRQHLQGDGQAGADRHGRGRRHHHDLLDRRDADLGPDDRHRQAVRAVAARAVRAGRGLGQCQEDRRGGNEAGRLAAPRRDRGRRYRGRSVQGHVIGGHEPDHQVHDAVRPAGRGARRYPQGRCRRGARDRPGTGVLRALGRVRLAVLLRHAGGHGPLVPAGPVQPSQPGTSAAGSRGVSRSAFW